ncbi:DNA-binding protein [Pasteurellaceae bacterium Macca]|nr:DNA-binding protein [Pasteurellaceae bacterium Macca]
MAFDQSVKNAVRRAYVFDRLNLEQIAEKTGVAVGTVRRWKAEAEKAGDNWEAARDVQVLAGGEVEQLARGLLAGFLIQYKKTMTALEKNDNLPVQDRVKELANLADSFAKMTASSRRILPETSEIATAMETVEIVFEVVSQHKPELLGDLLALSAELQVRVEQKFKKGR